MTPGPVAIKKFLWMLPLAQFIGFTAFAENRVVVRGRRADQIRISYPGAGWTFQAGGNSQDDLANHFKRNSSWDIPPVENPAPFGFSLPRIRGHDARFALLLIDDLVFADPYSALPVVEELDLPAFDSLDSTAGAAPFSVPAIAVHGALSFRLFSENPVPTERFVSSGVRLEDSQSAENSLRDPMGVTGWLRLDGKSKIMVEGEEPEGNGESGHSFQSRIYLRKTRSTGRYRYYDDGGTPLNDTDDEIRRRQNNDRESLFVLPAVRWQNKNMSSQMFLLFNESERGIPLNPQRSPVDSGPRQQQRLAAGQWSISRSLSSQGDDLKNEFTIAAGILDDSRAVEDPSGALLVVSDQDKRHIKTENYSAAWHGAALQSALEWNLQYRKSTARIDHQSNRAGNFPDIDAHRRSTDQFTAAARFVSDSDSDSALESKIDMVDISGDSNISLPIAWSIAGRFPGWNLGIEVPWDVSTYVQVAREPRAPSLLETTGDGALIQAAEGIRPESTRHTEVGVDLNWLESGAMLRAAVFQDAREDAIAIVPSSLLHYRAVNLAEKSYLSGVEFQCESNINWREVGISLPTTRISLASTWFETSAGSGRAIPGVPSDQAAVGVVQPVWRRPWRSFLIRWTARRRGRVYRDVANDILLPAWWVHDFALDMKWRTTGNKGGSGGWIDVEAGIGVTNVFDRMTMRYPTSGSEQVTTGYSDTWGVPLPGRALLVTLAAHR